MFIYTIISATFMLLYWGVLALDYFIPIFLFGNLSDQSIIRIFAVLFVFAAEISALLVVFFSPKFTRRTKITAILGIAIIISLLGMAHILPQMGLYDFLFPILLAGKTALCILYLVFICLDCKNRNEIQETA